MSSSCKSEPKLRYAANVVRSPVYVVKSTCGVSTFVCGMRQDHEVVAKFCSHEWAKFRQLCNDEAIISSFNFLTDSPSKCSLQAIFSGGVLYGSLFPKRWLRIEVVHPKQFESEEGRYCASDGQ